MRHARLVAVFAIAALGSSCAGGPSLADAVRAASNDAAEQGADAVADRTINVHELALGDCYNGEFDDDVVISVDVVPCDEPHDNELYARFDLQEGKFPGEERVVELSVQGCADRFAEFTGIDYADTALEITYFHPTRASWATLDDRKVVCAVYDPAGAVTGTLEGTGDDYAYAFEGDCMDEAWLKLDCAGEHYAEIYFEHELDGDTYPGDSAVESKAFALCEEEFAEFVGTTWADSALDYVAWVPGQESWEADYKVVSCAVYDPAGPLTGSVQGSGR